MIEQKHLDFKKSNQFFYYPVCKIALVSHPA